MIIAVFVTKSLLKLELTKTLTSGFEIKIKTLVADILCMFRRLKNSYTVSRIC